MGAATRTLSLIPPVIPDGWSVWRGVARWYARRNRSSPPLVARAKTRKELPAAIQEAVAERDALRESAQALLGERSLGPHD
jgi:hypothetical protein